MSSQMSVTRIAQLTTIRCCSTKIYVTQCSRVLLDKLTCSQPVKKFPECYGTLRFITVFVVGCEQCSHPTTATNHIQQNQRSTPHAVTHDLFSPEDGYNDARNMLRKC